MEVVSNKLDKNNLTLLYSEEQISQMIKKMASDITKDFSSSREPIVIISVLKGAFIFTADLIRHINLRVNLEFVRISSYGSGKVSTGNIEAPILALPDLNGKSVLIVEDIVDSGKTVKFLTEYINGQYKTKSLKIACLLNKQARREVSIKPDYIGFDVEDLFLVGYGLDFAEDYRHLPYLAVCD